MPGGGGEQDDAPRCMAPRRVGQPFDLIGAPCVIDQNGVPCPLRQQCLRHRDIRHHAGLAAPALQSPGHQRGLDGLRRHQHDRFAVQIRYRHRRAFAAIEAGRGERHRHLEGRTGAGLAFQRDAATHPLDDTLADAEPQSGAAIVPGDAVVGLLELAENPLLRLGRNADTGIAHQEADLIGPDTRLDNQRDATGRGEFDGVARQVEQHLPQPRRVSDHFGRQPLVDIGGDLDLPRLGPRRQQLGDVLDQGAQCERTLFEIDLAGLDLGVIQQLLDQRKQRIAGGFHRSRIGHLFRRQRRIQQQPAHADDAVERGANFMGGHGEEAGLGAARRIGEVAGLGQRAFGFGAVGHVAADALHFRRPAGVRSNQPLAPGDPSRPERCCDLLVVNPGAVDLDRGVALLEDGRHETAADQRVARPRDQFAIGIVDEGDAAFRVAQNDQIALRFEQAAGALLGLLQFPVAVGQRFIVQRDLAQPPAHPAQPDAQRGERDAGDREQETRTNGKGIRIVAGIRRSASGDEAIRRRRTRRRRS